MLDEAAFGGAAVEPKFVSTTDPAARWTRNVSIEREPVEQSP